MLTKTTYEKATFSQVQEFFPHYAEENQDFKVLFETCFATEKPHDYLVVHGQVKCRDFLGDIACSRAFHRPYSIYGFESNIPEWEKQHSFWINYPYLRVTFPSVKNKKNFLGNFDHILRLFRFPWVTDDGIRSYLNLETNQCLVPLCRSATPMYISLFTFLIKIAAQPIQEHDELLVATINGDVPKFVGLFKSIFNNKDASYFDRVDLNIFKYTSYIAFYSTLGTQFGYLSQYKDNINYLHNNSGFFSQFSKSNYSHNSSMFRRIIGTILTKCEEPVPFVFDVLPDEELAKLTSHKTTFVNEKGVTFNINGCLVTKQEKEKIPNHKKKSYVKQSTLNVFENFDDDTPMSMQNEGALAQAINAGNAMQQPQEAEMSISPPDGF